MKVSVSLPEDDVRFLDVYVETQGIASRSAALQRAVRLLRAHELDSSYEDAWQEWDDEGEGELWEVAASDGISDAKG